MSLVRNVKLVLRGFAWGALATSVCVFAVVQFANPDMTPVHLLLTYWPVAAMMVMAVMALAVTERRDFL